MNNFRTIDGSANNSDNLGQAGARLRRILDPSYGSDGVVNDLPRGIIEQEADNLFIGPSSLPNPREISNTVSAQAESVPNYLNASDWIWQWGQFLDHDLDLNEGASEPFFIPVDPEDPIADSLRRFVPEGSEQTQPLILVDSEQPEEMGLVFPLLDDTPLEEPISIEEFLNTVPADFIPSVEFISDVETDFATEVAPEDSELEVEISEEGIPYIPLTRIADADLSEPLRQYVNEITSFIDGSQVYGSEEERAEFLRANDGSGKLKSQTIDGEELLPLNTAGLSNANPLPELEDSELFIAGDVRANEQVGLTAAHTLFLREHNRIAEEIGDRLDRGDEAVVGLFEESGLDRGDFIYEAARKVVGAEIQFITYNEYLPLLLGDSLLEDYSGYDPHVNPNISLEFANVSFRLGHSQLSNEIQRVNPDGTEIDSIALRDAFFDPQIVKDNGIDSLLLGLPTQVAQEVDNLLVDGVRNFLFGAETGGFDLAAVNIQRGRDVGLPSYNDARRGLGLTPATSFLTTENQQGITSNPAIADRLASIYESIEDVDFWVGGISEDPVNGGLVGELFSKVLTEQFLNLRDGDRFFYLNDSSDLSILAPDLEQTTLAQIIEQNTPGEVVIQENAFLVPELSVEISDSQDDTNRLDFTVSLSDVSTTEITVDYETVDGVGKAGEDYVDTEGTLTFAPGEQTKTVSVELLDDAVLENNETFLLRLSKANNQNIAENLAVSRPTIDREISGTEADDFLRGGFARESIEGNEGNDTVVGGLGNDFLEGNEGNDYLGGEFNNSRVLDWVNSSDLFSTEGENDSIASASSFSRSSRRFGRNFFNSNDTQLGGNGNDTLDGGFGSDTQLGDDGDDVIIGDFNFGSRFNTFSFSSFFNSNDVQIGGNGNDKLTGGFGDDRLNGTGDRFGNGEIDELTGGSGRDTFSLGDRHEIFYARQNKFDYAKIIDFEVDNDIIELHGEMTHYVLAPTSGDLPHGTGIYLDLDSSGDFTSEADELIAISSQTLENFDGFSFV